MTNQHRSATHSATDISATGLNERAHVIFNRIVDRYLATGSPVGSKTVADDLDHMLSSASVRSVMAELEDAGLLFQPHTSAGRVPTNSGLRLFVNGLMEIGGNLTSAEQTMLDVDCQTHGLSFDDALAETSTMLSGLSRCAVLVAMPKTDITIKQIEFIPIEAKKVLAVLVSSTGQVENRIMPLPEGLPVSALTEAGNFINAHLAGKTLTEASIMLGEIISRQRAELDELTSQMVTSGMAVWTQGNAGLGGNLILRGHANLLENVTAIDQLDRIRRLFDQLEQQNNALDILATVEQADGIQIFIGAENRLFEDTDCTTIITPYRDGDNRVIGAIGVIGPTRLDYARIIPMVNYTGSAITRMLRGRL